MESIDLLIDARWLVPIEPGGVVHEHFSLAADHGRIVGVFPTSQAHERFAPREHVRRPGHVLLPGLVNAHTHAAMTLLRGVAEDMPFETWLGGTIWPLERRWVSAEFVRDGVELAVAEMLLAGVTCFADMYFHPEETARVAAAAHMRACIGAPIIDLPNPWYRNGEDCLSRAIQLRDAYRDHPLITPAFAPHAPYTVNDATLERIRILADETDAPVMIHLHETTEEIRQSLDKFGSRPIARLDRLGLLSPRLQAVHFVQADATDIAAAARSGINVIHCPESNLKLGNGRCPVAALRAAGVTVSLGTDGAASNNDLDIIGEMRLAALLAKGSDPQALDVHSALRMATLDGARSLGIEESTGSLEPGKWADLCCIDLDELATQPVHSVAAQLVYAANRSQVSDVWVAGRHLVAERELTRMDQQRLLAMGKQWRERIAAGTPGA